MKKILVMTDFSPRAEHASEVALQIAQKMGAEILLLNLFFVPSVMPAPSGVYPYYEEYAVIENEVSTKLERAAEALRKKTPSDVVKITTAQRPYALGNNVFEDLEQSEFDLIVMGDKRQTGAISDFLLGCITHEVIDKASCPILLVPESLSLAEKFKIAFASELEQPDNGALQQVTDFAALFNTDLIIVHVCMDELPQIKGIRAVRFIDQPVDSAQYDDHEYQSVKGTELEEVLAEYTQQADITVLAVVHYRYSFLKGLFHRSAVRKMLNHHNAMLLVLSKEFEGAKAS